MPAPIRNGHLVPEEEFETAQAREREDRLRRFTRATGVFDRPAAPRDPVSYIDREYDEPEPVEPRYHDHHSVAAAHQRLVEALNSRG